MLQMNYYADTWVLDDCCPCDMHFNDSVDAQNLRNKTIFHFGTGVHHIVGIRQATRQNCVLGITASKNEYTDYIELASKNAAVARYYIAYFGDIYLTKPELLPSFDVVTLFHLCEYFHKNTGSEEYGGLTDLGVLDLFAGKIAPGGHILFYTKSRSWEQAGEVVAAWEKTAPVIRVGEFKTLLVYAKTT